VHVSVVQLAIATHDAQVRSLVVEQPNARYWPALHAGEHTWQVPPFKKKPASHAPTAQMPRAQMGVPLAAVHTLPQSPQLPASLSRSTQERPHAIVPLPQLDEQAPWLHTSPAAGQVLPQRPQLAGSLSRLWHCASLHATAGEAHLGGAKSLPQPETNPKNRIMNTEAIFRERAALMLNNPPMLISRSAKLLFAVALTVSCSTPKKSGTDVAKRTAPLSVSRGNGRSATWGLEDLGRVRVRGDIPTERGAASAWSLRDVAATLLDKGERITALSNAQGQTLILSPADWADQTRLPLLRVNHRGSWKFDWVDASTRATLGDGMRDVSGITVSP
jgi:hypothetical protein